MIPVYISTGILMKFSGIKLSYSISIISLFLIISLYFLLNIIITNISNKECNIIYKLYLIQSIMNLGALGLFFIIIGAISLDVRISSINSPVFSADKKITKIWGNIENITPLEKGYRVILTNLFIPKIDRDKLPDKVRLKILTRTNNATIGDRVKLTAVLSPPMKPYLTGSYDFARDAFFKKIGAVGYAISDITVLKSKRTNLIDKINRYRNRILQKISYAIGSRSGSIASALMINEYNNIDKADLKALRISGLAHILSVSGMHLSLAAAIFFISTRFILNCLGTFPLNYNTKKIAALISLLGTLAYLLISGMEVAAVRAFIMTSTIIISIVIDRNTDSLRTLSFAASIILILSPENIILPSFQMSFAAVLALVAAYEIYIKFNFNILNSNFFNKSCLYLFNICFASIIAGLATTPFVIYHFGQSSNYGVLANLIAIPITTFWLMPLVVVTFFLIPFNLENISLKAMKPGIDLILKISHFVAELPNSVSNFAKLSNTNLLIITLGIILLCILKTKLRIIGILIILMAIINQLYSPKPNIFIDWNKSSIAVLNNDNQLIFLKNPLPKFKRELLMNYLGANKFFIYPEGKDDNLYCHNEICHLHKSKYLVKFNLINLEIEFWNENKISNKTVNTKGVLLTNEYSH